MTDIIERIRKTELKGDQAIIAGRITSDLHRVAFLTGAQLASDCNVSVSAITRFAQRLGYNGFPALKRDLEGLYRQSTTPYEMFESFVKGSGGKSVYEVSMAQDLENIDGLKRNFNREEFEKALDLIDGASMAHLSAIASSEILVDALNAYLMALEVPTNLLKSFGVTKVAELTDFEPNQVLIGFSFQRIVREVRDLFQYVKPYGVKTIAITDSPINALATEADVVVIAPVVGTTFGLSHVAPLMLINLISNGLAAKDKKKSLRKLKKAKREWEKRPIFCEPLQGGDND